MNRARYSLITTSTTNQQTWRATLPSTLRVVVVISKSFNYSSNMERKSKLPVVYDALLAVQCSSAALSRARPLHIASRKGYCEIVKLLISNGADQEALDRLGFTPLHFVLLSLILFFLILRLSSSSIFLNSKGSCQWSWSSGNVPPCNRSSNFREKSEWVYFPSPRKVLSIILLGNEFIIEVIMGMRRSLRPFWEQAPILKSRFTADSLPSSLSFLFLLSILFLSPGLPKRIPWSSCHSLQARMSSKYHFSWRVDSDLRRSREGIFWGNSTTCSSFPCLSLIISALGSFFITEHRKIYEIREDTLHSIPHVETVSLSVLHNFFPRLLFFYSLPSFTLSPGRLYAVKILVKVAACDVNAVTPDGSSPLSLACRRDHLVTSSSSSLLLSFHHSSFLPLFFLFFLSSNSQVTT